jgi:hypothetical protein
MGSADTKIETSGLPQQLLRAATAPLPAPFIPPFRKFNDLLYKTAGCTTTYHLTVLEPYHEEVSVSIEVFPILKDAFDCKTESIVVEGVVADEEVLERWLFQGTAQ